MEGGTTFHFLDASPAKALETAREAAGGEHDQEALRHGGSVTKPPGWRNPCPCSMLA